jgi:transposase
MLYLGIDQHARQITISLRDEGGDVLQARQVSTQPDKIHAFFQQLTRERLPTEASFVAVLEVCGFNDWLIRMLQDYHCHKVILIQPDDRKKCKTDRRDAAALSELLWVNRDRLLQGKPVRGLRQVDIASSTDQENRRLTTLRKEAGQARTRLVNKVRHILRRHNLQWQMPTKRFPTKAGIAWLKPLVLPEIDRLEMNHLLTDIEQIQQRVKELEQVIAQRCGVSAEAVLLSSMPGVSYFTATSLACRVGRVERFPRAQSLANYWGLTPGCRNSGENTQRLGNITKEGSHWDERQRHGAVAAGASDAQGAAQGRPATGVVQTDQAAPGVHHRPRGGDAQTGHDHLAHAEPTEDLCRVPSSRGGRDERKGPAEVWLRGAAKLLGLRPRPRDLALGCQSRMAEGGLVPPHSVWAPGTALGSVPTVALSSAQARGIVGAPKGSSNWTNQRGEEMIQDSARLFDRSCPVAT